jgi:hypothetical protein
MSTINTNIDKENLFLRINVFEYLKKVNKHVLMASLTYNLKKYLRFTIKKPSILAQVIALKKVEIYTFCSLFLKNDGCATATAVSGSFSFLSYLSIKSNCLRNTVKFQQK